MQHYPVLLEKILAILPEIQTGTFVDFTFGGGGHFFSILDARPRWKGLAIDRDFLAKQRFHEKAESYSERSEFELMQFSDFKRLPESPIVFALADLGFSSFQVDDPDRGMSWRSDSPLDFRMNPNEGPGFEEWLSGQTVDDLQKILDLYGEEPRAKKLAKAIKQMPSGSFSSAKVFSEKVAQVLSYTTESRRHPATRCFQALRMAVNNEVEELKSILESVPKTMTGGGSFAVISFHSIEDRLVKKAFRRLASRGDFVILNKDGVIPDKKEIEVNPRARSARLRVLKKIDESEDR